MSGVSGGPSRAGRLRVAVLDDYERAAVESADWSAVSAFAEVVAFPDHPDSARALIDRLRSFDAVVLMRERTPLPREVLAALDRRGLIVTTGRFNASIDLDAAREFGIVVSGTELRTSQTVELAWALVMSSLRDIPGQDRAARAGEWARSLGTDAAGSTLGLIGLGRIGSEMARIAAAFSMRVLAWSENLTPERALENGAEYASLAQLLRESDVVSLHLRLSDRSRGLIGREELRAIGPSGWLVNTSRGPLVDEAALVAALESGELGGAALDVFDVEPLPPGHPLFTTPNTILSPHAGFATRRSYRSAYGQVVEDIVAWREGTPLRVLGG